jgi:UDP-glucose 4-epimerase
MMNSAANFLSHLASKEFKPLRVVVIGKNGFIGSELIVGLRKNGVNTLEIGREDIDLTAPEATAFMRKTIREGDTVVFTAGDIPVRNLLQFENNMSMLRNFLIGIENVDIQHLIYVSSDAVFMDLDSPLTEDSLRAPGTLHGAMHLTREIALESSKFQDRLCVVRPTLIYGHRDPHNSYGPCSFIRLAKKSEPIVLFGNGEERRDFIHVSDISDILRHIIKNGFVGALNLATGEVHSFFDLANMILEISGSNSPILHRPRVGQMPHNGYRPFDVHNIKVAFPDLQIKSLRDGLIFMNAGH